MPISTTLHDWVLLNNNVHDQNGSYPGPGGKGKGLHISIYHRV